MRRLQLAGLLFAIFAALGIGASHLTAYSTEGHVWGKSTVPYYVNPANKYISDSAAVAAIKSSASGWSGYANIQLSYAGNTSDASLSNNGVNEVFFRDDTSSMLGETYWWYDGTGRLVDADIVIHENWTWYSANIGCTNGGYYVENTATHEFGHVLGLGHSSVDTATMWPSSGSCETIRETLDPDDINGIQALYPGGTPSSTTTAPNAPSQLTAGADSGNPTGALDLSWVDNASNASGYVVERSLDGSSFAQIASLGSNAVSYRDSGLAAGTTYYYFVYAYNSAGPSSNSNVASGQTQTATAPAPTSQTAPSAPSNPSPSSGATGVNTTVNLGWSSTGATSYDVYFNGSLYASNIAAASVKVSGLGSGATYSWSVVAKNSAGSTAGPAWSFTTRGKGKR